MEISGPSIKLRYATRADAPAMFELARDPEVTRFFAWSYERRADAEAWIASLAGRRDTGQLLELAIVDSDGQVIGATGLSELARRDRRATVGTWLGRAHWGSGANAESKALVTALAFGPLGLERLTAYASTENVRSQAALQRVGFRREGVLREFHRHPGQTHDVVVLSMLRSDWERSSLPSVPVEISGPPPPAFVVG